MKKTVWVSDLSGAELEPRGMATITCVFGDRRRGRLVLELTAEEAVELMGPKAIAQKARGRTPGQNGSSPG